MKTELDPFTRAYLECMLWSSSDESTDNGGDPLDENYGLSDIAPAAIAQAIADCERFQFNYSSALEASGITRPRAGFLFWLNRNGHGSGFWDEGGCAAEYREKLSAAAKSFGDCSPYVGDDGLIYFH